MDKCIHIVLALLLSMEPAWAGRKFDPFRCPLPELSSFRQAPPHTSYGKSYLLRTHNTPDGPFHERLDVIVYEGEGAFRRYVIRRSVVKGESGVDPAEIERLGRRGITDAKSEDIHFSLIASALRENLDRYRDRRSWWQSKLRELWETGRETINDSTYVVTVRKSDDAVVGLFRDIVAPYGIRDGQVVAEGPTVAALNGPVTGFATPEHRYDPVSGLPRPLRNIPGFQRLGIEPARPAVRFRNFPHLGEGGIWHELGAFYIDEKLSPKERDEVWSEWVDTLIKLSHDWDDFEFVNYGQSFGWYVDEISRRIYHPMNAVPLSPYTRDGHTVVVKPDDPNPPRYEFKGEKWLPVQWHLADIERYYAEFSAHQVPRHDNVEAWKILARRAQDGSLFDPHGGLVMTTDSFLTTPMFLWAATEEKLPRHVNYGATGMLVRQIELMNTHLRVWQREGDDKTDLGRLAAKNATAMQKDFVYAHNALLDMRFHKNPEFRLQLARYYNQLLQDHDAPLMNAKEVISDFVGVSLFDSDVHVREQALWAFRELSAVRVRRALGQDQTAAWKALTDRGITREQAQPAIDALAKILREPKPLVSTEGEQLAYWNRLKPYLREVEKLRRGNSADGQLGGPLLLLAAARP